MNANVCVHARLLKLVCVRVCAYFVEFYFCEIPFQLFSRIHLYLSANFGSTIITLGIVNLEFLWDF